MAEGFQGRLFVFQTFERKFEVSRCKKNLNELKMLEIAVMRSKKQKKFFLNIMLSKGPNAFHETIC